MPRLPGGGVPVIETVSYVIGAGLLMVLIGCVVGAALGFLAESYPVPDDERARVRARADESLARHLTRPYGVDIEVQPREKGA